MLLNLLAPGAGPSCALSPGAPRCSCWPTPSLLALMLILAAAAVPSFMMFTVLAGLLLIGVMTVLIALIVQTWYRGPSKSSITHWWSRWHGMVEIALLVHLTTGAAMTGLRRLYKPFYAPGESMAPTILKNDKFLADMRGGRSPRRGDAILIEAHRLIRITHIVGLPGDWVAMRMRCR
jgi:hypothetical protein